MSDQPILVSTDTQRSNRIPPGQFLTQKWPVLHAGSVPRIDLQKWQLQLFGLVEKAVVLNWSELQAQPSVKIFADMHCVTRWSMLDNTWEGVSTRHLASLAGIKPEARYVIAHGAHGFTTNMPLADFLDEDCLVAWSRNGEALDPDHGWPLRLVIPKLYAWKSAKWLLGLEFSATDEPGFWEQNGYHNHGDPWTEERFWD
ncbi:MAG: sulfite oxidase-like oxidoreductase [bacterium]